MTPEQFAFMKERRGAPAKPARARTKQSRAALPENQVESQVVPFLQSLGWRVYRLGVGGYHDKYGNWVSYGERGAADWMAWRPVAGWPGWTELLFVECKARGKKPEPHQLKWLDGASASGACATWTDQYEGFKLWYAQRFGRHGGDPPGRGL
jgi:hypothetical protein